MKKIILLFLALFITISTANAATDPGVALNNGVTEEQLLDTLISEGMSLAEAVDAILNAGGDQGQILTAAVMLDSDFQFTDNQLDGGEQQANNDPVGGLPVPGAGGDDNTPDPVDNTDFGDIDLALNDPVVNDDRTGVSP